MIFYLFESTSQKLLLLLLSSLFSSLLYYSYSSLLYYSFPLYTTPPPLYSTILLSMFVNSEHIYFWLFLPSAATLCLLSSCCFFCQISPLLSSPLFYRWWYCLSPYIIWNMSWWSRTWEELGIITNRPYITFSSLLCYDALMLQVHDQMMIDMFLRPLLLLLLVFLYIVFL